jgi:hypothetical protein
MTKGKGKHNDIKHIDSVPEVAAYGLKGFFSALGSWKKTLRLALLLAVGIAGAIVAKWIWTVLQ